MAEQDEQRSPTPESQTQLSLNEVFDQAFRLQKRADLTLSHIQSAVSPEAWEKIEDLPQHQQVEAAHTYLTDTATADHFAEVEPYFDFYKDVLHEQQSLEKQESARAHAEAQRVTGNLLATTDWDKVAAEFTKVSPEDRAIPYNEAVVCMRSLGAPKQPLSLLETERTIHDADHLGKIFDAAGFRLTEPSPESEWHIEGNLPQAIQEWMKLAKQSGGYISDSRVKWFNEHAPIPQLASLLVSLRHMNADQSPLPTVVTEAFEHAASDVISAFLDKEKEYMATELESRPNSLFIQNMAEASKVFGLEPEEISAIISETFSELPKHFSSGLGFIEFVHKAAPTAAKWQKGEVKGKENKMELELGDYIIEKERHEASGATPDQAHQLALDNLKKTVRHELGHYIHTNVLTVEELMVWQEALNEEPKPISRYVARLVRENEENTRINNEQFGESWEEFMAVPLFLKKDFPRRYAALKSITDKYGMHTTGTSK